MRAVIPAAGVGKRLRPHTYTLPKALLSVAGKPIIGHILDGLVSLGVQEVVLVVGYRGDKLVDYVNEHYRFKRVQYVEQEEREGLGHAVFLAKPFVGTEPLLIIYGDTIFEGRLDAGIDDSVDGCIGVKGVVEPKRFGIVEVEGDRIVRLVEKPKAPRSNLAIVGVNYIKNSKLLFLSLAELMEKDIRTKGEYQLTDAFQLMVDKGAWLRGFTIEGWFDCGKPESLLVANRHLLNSRSRAYRIEGSVVIPPVFVSDMAKIESSILGPYLSVADRAVVTRSIVRNSIIGEGARVESCLLDGSLVGDNALVKGSYNRLNVGDSSEVVFR